MTLSRILGKRQCEFCPDHKSQNQKSEVKYLAVYPTSNPMYVTPACEQAWDSAIGGYLLVPINGKLELALRLIFSERDDMSEIARFLAELHRQSVSTTR